MPTVDLLIGLISKDKKDLWCACSSLCVCVCVVAHYKGIIVGAGGGQICIGLICHHSFASSSSNSCQAVLSHFISMHLLSFYSMPHILFLFTIQSFKNLEYLN